MKFLYASLYRESKFHFSVSIFSSCIYVIFVILTFYLLSILLKIYHEIHNHAWHENKKYIAL